MKVQVNKWLGYKFESYEEATVYENATIRTLDKRWNDPGQRVEMEVGAGDVKRSFRMEGAEISYDRDAITFVGFVQEDKYPQPPDNRWRKEYWEILER